MSAFKRTFNKKTRKRKSKKIKKRLIKIEKLKLKSKKNDLTKHKFELKKLKNKKNVYLKHIILQTLILFLLLFPGVVIFVNPQKLFFNYKEYVIGEHLEIYNNNWYVIKDSDNQDDSLVLLSEFDFDLNKDGIVNKEDMIDFDTVGNILETTIKSEFNNFQIEKIRLLTSEEYILAREKMKFGYDWKNENFLAGKSKGKWWLQTKKYEKILSVNINGTYDMSDETDKNFVRPVIEILKFNIN